MLLTLDPHAGPPLYQQIIEQVKRRVALRALREGDRLPSVRELARQTRVNPNTVAKAYLELEREGVVETRRGTGTFVSGRAPRLTKAERRRLLTEACDRAAVEGVHLGFDAEEMKTLFAERTDIISGKHEEDIA